MGWLAPFLVYNLRKKNLIMNKEIGRKYGHLTVVEDTGRRYITGPSFSSAYATAGISRT
jgi:hypothetical protein